jgi:DNA-binding IclR family transcriptional regulator
MNETPPNTLRGEKSPVLKALRLLANLARSSTPVALPELSRVLGLPKPTAFRLARILEQGGFVKQDPLTRRYALGPGFDELALNALRNGAAQHTRQQLMNQLSERLGVRINLAVLKSGKLLYVEWVGSTSPLRIDIQPGTPVPVHCSAGGKLLMAFAPEELREHFLQSAPFQAHTKNTLTTAEELAKEFALIRRRGYAEDRQEFMPGVSCLSVPVRNRASEVVAGLAIMAPEASFPLAKSRSHRADLQACAGAISADLGWQPSREGNERRPASAKVLSGAGTSRGGL